MPRRLRFTSICYSRESLDPRYKFQYNFYTYIYIYVLYERHFRWSEQRRRVIRHSMCSELIAVRWQRLQKSNCQTREDQKYNQAAYWYRDRSCFEPSISWSRHWSGWLQWSQKCSLISNEYCKQKKNAKANK